MSKTSKTYVEVLKFEKLILISNSKNILIKLKVFQPR